VLVDRYVLLRVLGAGGGGRVYEAYDPELDRYVAIKLRHGGETADDRADTARLRLLREAKAMASLRHPNVVQVFDAGAFGDSIFVAMELVEGGTLRGWLKTPHSRQEVLRVLIAAGRGLAAAHARGLVHRDFKPDNVLMGATSLGEQRVLVTDFGLVHETRHGQSGTPSPSSSSSSPSPPSSSGSSGVSAMSTMTKEGDVLGTPGYMAPEQYRGEPTSSRTDQFAFCVVLWEALQGKRLFAGSLIERMQATVAGLPPAAFRELPRRVAGALSRGLAVKPEDRWPSMYALLDELPEPPARRVAPWMLAVAITASIGAVLASRYATTPSPCSGARDRLREVWDAAAKARLETAIQRGDSTGDAPRTLRIALDEYADRWAAMHEAVCLAGLRREDEPELQALKMDCLSGRLDDVRAVTSMLSRDAPVDRASGALSALRPLAPCEDVVALRAPVPLPDSHELRVRVAATRAGLSEARAELFGGDVHAAEQKARTLTDEARGTAHLPLVAEALVLRGTTEQSLGEFAKAEATLEDALLMAERGHNDSARAEALVRLTFVVGYGLARRPDGLRWSRLADATVERVRDRGLQADAAHVRAVVCIEAADRSCALEAARRAVTIGEEVRGPNHMRTLSSVNALGSALELAGDLAGAEAAYRRAIDAYERLFGPRHVLVAAPLANLGSVYTRLGRFDEAITMIRRSNDLEILAYGPEHMDSATGAAMLSEALRGAGHLDAALAEANRSIALYEKEFGPTHVDLYRPLMEKGLALLMKRDVPAAIDALERATLLARVGEVDAHHSATCRIELARAYVTAGRARPRALALAREARTIYERAEPPDSIGMVSVDAFLAKWVEK
jgi:serine/threonine protein kinase